MTNPTGAGHLGRAAGHAGGYGVCGARGGNGRATEHAIGTAAILAMLTEQNNQGAANATKPRAFVNVILFAEQFKAVSYKLSMVGGVNELKQNFNDLQNIPVVKNGYLYVYCSNESDMNVYFDNMQSLPRTCFGVVHTRGALLEETVYYLLDW